MATWHMTIWQMTTVDDNMADNNMADDNMEDDNLADDTLIWIWQTDDNLNTNQYCKKFDFGQKGYPSIFLP